MERKKSLDDIDRQCFGLQDQFRLPDRNWNPRYEKRRQYVRQAWTNYTLNIRAFFECQGPQSLDPESRATKLPRLIYQKPRKDNYDPLSSFAKVKI